MTANHRVLQLAVGCGTMAVKRRWRALAAQYHPDRLGGDATVFSTYYKARQAVMRYETDLEATCPSCQGLGFLIKAKGFSSLKLPCAQCGGNGKFVKE